MFKIIFCLNNIHYKLAREVPGFAIVLYAPSRLKNIEFKDCKLKLKLYKKYYLLYALLMLIANKIYLPHFIINPLFFHIARLKNIILIDDGLDYYRIKPFNLLEINKFKVKEYLTFSDNVKRPFWLSKTINMTSNGSNTEKLDNAVEISDSNIVILSTGITLQIVHDKFGSNFFLKQHSNKNKNINFESGINYIDFEMSNDLNIFNNCVFMIGVSYGAIEIINYINESNKIILIISHAEKSNNKNFILKVNEFKNVEIIYVN
jgi:hypothetical protein